MSRTVTVATVTYGSRAYELAAVLDGVAQLNGADSVSEIIVVDNGSDAATKDVIAESGATVVDLVTNQGSAAGFAAAITSAVKSDGDYIWMLDDDNRPRSDALDKLFAAVESNPPGCVFQAMRPNYEQFTRLEAGESTDRVFGTRNAFMDSAWSHDVRSSAPRHDVQPFPELLWGLYGGLFGPKESFEAVEGPRPEFFVYVDDTEFTARLATAVGLRLVPDAVIDDVDAPWWLTDRRSPDRTMAAVTDPEELERLYYAVRNVVYFQKTTRRTSRSAFLANRLHRYLRQVRSCVVEAVRTRSVQPLRVLRVFHIAVRHGLRGRLGRLASSPWGPSA